MLVFDKRLLKTTRQNLVVKPVYEDDDENGKVIGYIYSDLDTFCQAHSLAVRFEGSTDALIKVLALNNSHKEEVEYFASVAPFPFNMLGPFLGLCDFTVKMEKTVEELCEYLHVLGRILSFDRFVAIPVPARVNTMFNKITFAFRKEEIKQFKYALREVEDTADTGIVYISDEEVKRLGGFARLIAENLGGFNTTPTVSAEVAPVVIGEKTVPEGELDLEPDLQSDWADFRIPPLAQWREETTSGVSTTTTSSEAFQNKAMVDEEEDDKQGTFDLIAQIASGAANVNALVGGE